MNGLRERIVLAAAIGLIVPMASPPAQENCRPVRFARGQSAAVIHGTAPPDGTICYSFAAGVGQTANLRVTGNNMIMSVIGVGDDRTSWTFKTKAQSYKFIVAQEMRSVTPEPYTVTLSIR